MTETRCHIIYYFQVQDTPFATDSALEAIQCGPKATNKHHVLLLLPILACFW